MRHSPPEQLRQLPAIGMLLLFLALWGCAGAPDRETQIAKTPPVEETGGEPRDISLTLPPSEFSDLFSSAEASLGRFDWMSAEVTLEAIPVEQWSGNDRSYLDYLQARIAYARGDYQQALKDANPDWHAEVFRYKPDGDAELAENSHDEFCVPGCAACDGIVKPDVVMFGETVPKDRVHDAFSAIDRANALLVVGSSLILFSGFRFARQAAAQQKPIAVVNQGRTRADDIAELKIEADCGDTLSAAAALLAS